MRIILASSSPRRKEILQLMNLDFETIPANINEKEVEDKNTGNLVLNIAKNKAKHIEGQMQENCIIIAADTVVDLDKDVLGKPKDEKDAVDMLSKLQGNTCKVYTGMSVIVLCKGKVKEYTDMTECEITFKKLTEEQIQEYVNTKEPLDKAGAFAIQGFGARYIRKINGDFFSAIGLSVCSLYDILIKIQEDFDVEILK